MFFTRRLSAQLIAAGAMLVLACGDRAPRAGAATPPSSTALIDAFGDTLSVSDARRIASLNPVATEALFALGAGARVVGRTHWDGTPREVLAVTDLGPGMQPNVEAVLAVKPDLVILYASESNRAAAQALHRAGVATLTLHTDRLAEFAPMLHALGLAINDTAAAAAVRDSVQRSLDAVRAMPAFSTVPTVFWHAWDNPVITIGAGSYLGDLVELAGARNSFGDLTQPSPQVTLEAVAARNPQFMLAGPVAGRTMRESPRWQSVPAVRAGHILTVDTALVARPGVRMGEAARHLRALLDSALRAK